MPCFLRCTSRSQGDRTPEVLSAILKLPSAYTRRPLESLPQSEAKRRAEAINTLARFTVRARSGRVGRHDAISWTCRRRTRSAWRSLDTAASTTAR